jgi:hypothetical protein
MVRQCPDMSVKAEKTHEKPQIGGVPAEIRTGHLPNTNKKRYYSSKLLWEDIVK